MRASYTLPPEYHKFDRDNRFLFIDPRNFVWFSTDGIGSRIIESLALRGKTIDALNAVVEESDGAMSIDDASQYVEKFLNGLMQLGFLHEEGYVLRSNLPRDQLPVPQVMYLHLSSGCNLRCPYCYNQEHRYALKRMEKQAVADKSLTKPRLEHFLRLIDQAAELGFKEIKLTGGEALLNKNAMLIARYARSKRIFVNLLTNATLITPGLAQEIAASVDVVSVSLDSKSPEAHDSVRGEGTHKKVLSAIRLLREAGLERLHINGVITPMTLDSAEDLLAYAWDEIGASHVTLSGSALQVNDPTNRWGAAAHVLSDEQYASLEDKVAAFYGARAGVKYGPSYRNQCGVGNGLVSIDSNGDVYPCQTLHAAEFLSGNVFKSGLKNVLQTSDVIRDARNTTVDTIEECNVCPVRYICASGCRSEAWSREGSLRKRNKALCPSFFKRAVNQLWESVAG